MLEDQLDAASKAPDLLRAQIIEELATNPDVMLPMALEALQHPPKARWEVAVQLVRAIGYPRNAAALPALISHLSDPNWPGWSEAGAALADMGPTVVVPPLLAVLGKRDPGNNHGIADVEGICAMLCQIEAVYAQHCGPMIAYRLAQRNHYPDLDASWLLDVLERAGPPEISYALPALIELVEAQPAPELRAQAQRIINAFDGETLAPYRLLLATMGVSMSA